MIVNLLVFISIKSILISIIMDEFFLKREQLTPVPIDIKQ